LIFVVGGTFFLAGASIPGALLCISGGKMICAGD
jgi:hypothetical protein